MKKTFYDCKKKERQEKISNRMLISFGYAAIVLFAVVFLKGRVDTVQIGYNAFRSTLSLIFYVALAIAVVLYALSLADKVFPESKIAKLSVKERFRNYGHLFIAIAVIAFYLNLPHFTSGWLPTESAPVIIGFLKNTAKAFTITIYGLVAYMIFTVVYHMYLYYIKKW